MEVGPSLMAQAHSRSGQRAECSRHCEIEQELEKIEKKLRHRHRGVLLLNALRLSNEALSHTTETGDHHQSDTRYAPAHIAATGFEVPPRHSQAGDRDHGRDDV